MGFLQGIKGSHRLFYGLPASRRRWSLGFLLLICLPLFSQERKEKKLYMRLMAGPVLSFYQNNTFHTQGTKPRAAWFGCLLTDIRIHKDFSFLAGAEYDYHGLTFNSYYMAPGYQWLYDKHFDYNYRLTMQEVRVNLLIKQVIGIETRNTVTGYTSCGYVLRYILNSNLQVNSNLTGMELFNGNTNLTFEHPVFQSNMASAVKFIAGVQRNFFNSHRAFFFESSFTFSLSRFQLKESFTPSSLYINGSFLQLGLGFKF
jgi:hypothetical protein